MGFQHTAVLAVAGGILLATITGCGSESDSASATRGGVGVASASVQLLDYLPPSRMLDTISWYDVDPQVEEILEPMMEFAEELIAMNPKIMEQYPQYPPPTMDVFGFVTGTPKGEDDDVRGILTASNFASQMDPEQEDIQLFLLEGTFSEETTATIFGGSDAPLGPDSLTDARDGMHVIRVAENVIAVSSDETLLRLVTGDGSGMQAFRPAFAREVEELVAGHISGFVIDSSPEVRAAMRAQMLNHGPVPETVLTTMDEIALVSGYFGFQPGQLSMSLRLTTTTPELAEQMAVGASRAFDDMRSEEVLAMLAESLPESMVDMLQSMKASSTDNRFLFEMTMSDQVMSDLIEFFQESMGSLEGDYGTGLSCQSNQHMIDSSIMMLILEENLDDQAAAVAMVEENGGLEWLVGPDRFMRVMPQCPEGGEYTLQGDPEALAVTCSHPGHEVQLEESPAATTPAW